MITMITKDTNKIKQTVTVIEIRVCLHDQSFYDKVGLSQKKLLV